MRICVRTLVVALVLGLVVAEMASAQRPRREKRQEARAEETETQPPTPNVVDDANLVASLGMFVYPAGGQSAEQQEADELECTAWARGQVAEMAEAAPPSGAEAAEDETGRRGKRSGDERSALKGAAKGAVVGAALEDDYPNRPKSADEIGDNVKVDKDKISAPESRDDIGDNKKHVKIDDGPSAAEIGAVAGAVAGRQRDKKSEAKAETQAAAAEMESAEQAELDRLKKALKVCLEAKGYKVE